MTPQRYENLRRLFLETCDLASEERARVLKRLCPDDPALRALAESLARMDAKTRQARLPP
jgi:hypothetical protein